MTVDQNKSKRRGKTEKKDDGLTKSDKLHQVEEVEVEG